MICSLYTSVYNERDERYDVWKKVQLYLVSQVTRLHNVSYRDSIRHHEAEEKESHHFAVKIKRF